MITTSKEVDNLNDLVLILNDRVVGYETALKELKPEDADLKSLFTSLIDQSRKLKLALGTEVEVLGGDISTGTTNSGKLYRVWMDVKAVFTGKDRHAVLSNCEAGEDAAQRAYKSALESNDLAEYLRDLLTEQKATLKEGHDKIKALRDATK